MNPIEMFISIPGPTFLLIFTVLSVRGYYLSKKMGGRR